MRSKETVTCWECSGLPVEHSCGEEYTSADKEIDCDKSVFK